MRDLDCFQFFRNRGSVNSSAPTTQIEFNWYGNRRKIKSGENILDLKKPLNAANKDLDPQLVRLMPDLVREQKLLFISAEEIQEFKKKIKI